MANLMTNDAELKAKCNTLCITKEWSRIFSEGLWTNSSRFLKIRVEVLFEALMVQHKYGHTQTIPGIYNMNNMMQCKI